MSTASKKGPAIVAITRNGARIGRTIKALMPESDLYVIDKFAIESPGERSFSVPAGKLIDDVIGRYAQLVLVMAVGIAVRLVTPSVKNKRTDAGVTVIDDSGRFVISLLAGHIGGANALALKIASLIGAQPVITTASDTRGFASLDLLAVKFGWKLESSRNLTRVSAALINDEAVALFQDAGDTSWSAGDLSPKVRVLEDLGALKDSGLKAVIVITDRSVAKDDLKIPSVVFHPPSLVVGIGCNRGTACDVIEQAVSEIFSKNGLSLQSIRSLATASLKRNEPGLLEFARKHDLPVEYFDKEELAATRFPSEPSAAALKHIGLPSVCEAAAVLAGDGNLIVPKSRFYAQVTLAVSRILSLDSQRKGKLFIVGIGPGDAAHMTVRARQAISESGTVVGYKTYIDLCAPLLAGKDIMSGAMGQEVERVNLAIDLAARGKTVSLISSGDPGIYGMSGLAAEILLNKHADIEVEIVPGVPAMVSAASLLGAPLNIDVASISLSDHLVPWPDIVRRIESAAESDFVIAIYNPKSRARRGHLAKAREIILGRRRPSTPVGIVSNAYRPGQTVTIASLETMLDHPVDMDSLVIIGNSTTQVCGDRLITPRGYSNKYNLIEKKKRRRQVNAPLEPG